MARSFEPVEYSELEKCIRGLKWKKISDTSSIKDNLNQMKISSSSNNIPYPLVTSINNIMEFSVGSGFKWSRSKGRPKKKDVLYEIKQAVEYISNVCFNTDGDTAALVSILCDATKNYQETLWPLFSCTSTSQNDISSKDLKGLEKHLDHLFSKAHERYKYYLPLVSIGPLFGKLWPKKAHSNLTYKSTILSLVLGFFPVVAERNMNDRKKILGKPYRFDIVSGKIIEWDQKIKLVKEIEAARIKLMDIMVKRLGDKNGDSEK